MILFLFACAELQSTDVTNAELAIEALATTDGVQTEVDAKITRGQGIGWTPVHLGGDEALVGYHGDEEFPLAPVEMALGDVVYSDTLTVASGGEEVGVRFDRTADDTIDGTVVTMPADFAITTPVDGATVWADSVLIVLWDATGDGAVTVTLSGDCIPGYELDNVDDVGEADIPGEALASEGQSCAASVAVVRTATGTVSDLWGAGGTISAQNGRMTTFVVQTGG